MSTDWNWYFSRDGEMFHGEFGSKEQAIAEGWDFFEGEGSMIVLEARHGEPSCKIFDADRVFEDFEEANEEHWGEDGQPFTDIKFEKPSDLEDMLAATLRIYLVKNNAMRSWMFADQRNETTINMDRAYYFEFDEYSTLLLGAFRDALGKEGAPVVAMVEILKPRIGQLGYLAKRRITSEITSAIDSGNAGSKTAVNYWKQLLDA